MAARGYLTGFCGLLLIGGLHLDAQTPPCSQGFTEKQKQTVTDYVRKRYKLPDTITLSLKSETAVRDTCFHELIFEGKSSFRTWGLTLYASPDARFLTDDLYDTTIDPVLEQKEKDEAVMKGLVQGPSATRGPENARVTIVVFSDFECPFCRKFAQILAEALPSNEGDVRVVFHHLPLPMHPWARMAAEMAGCAQLQSNEAFWSLHDKIFENQTAVTADNAKDKLAGFAKDTKGLDEPAFQKCMTSAMSVGLVLKDMDLAEANHISGTPTLFINGHRLQSVESAAKLRELIEEARKEAAPPPASVALKTARAGQ
jgi:protein-disulfide isomerase